MSGAGKQLTERLVAMSGQSFVLYEGRPAREDLPHNLRGHVHSQKATREQALDEFDRVVIPSGKDARPVPLISHGVSE